MRKLGQKQTKDRIADMLRKEILSGRIADGDELAQEKLAEQLQVSRMPVREALQSLEVEGLLTRLPNRHMQVVGINQNMIHANMRVIAAVEAEIATILSENNPDCSKLDMNNDYQFHLKLSQQLNNPYLYQVHKRLLAGYPLYAWESCGVHDTEKNNKILQALKTKDASMLSACIYQYYQNLAQILLAQVKENSHEQPETN